LEAHLWVLKMGGNVVVIPAANFQASFAEEHHVMLEIGDHRESRFPDGYVGLGDDDSCL
jgi:hypothetical protein